MFVHQIVSVDNSFGPPIRRGDSSPATAAHPDDGSLGSSNRTNPNRLFSACSRIIGLSGHRRSEQAYPGVGTNVGVRAFQPDIQDLLLTVRRLGVTKADRQKTNSGQKLPPALVMVVRHMQHQVCQRSEEHTSELQSLMRNSYAVFCLKKKKKTTKNNKLQQL